MSPTKASSSSAERQLLLERAGKVRLWAVSQGRRTVYEVEAGASRWVFNLLFPAIGKFDRIGRKGGTP